MIYKAELTAHSIFWFNSLSYPHSSGYVQKVMPVIHNYPLTIAFLGRLVEESYVGAYNLPSYKGSKKLYEEGGIYVYPAVFDRTFYMRLTMSISESDYVLYKPQTRWAVPILTTNNVISVGSKATTYVISSSPLDVRYIRLGVKRGTMKVFLKEMKEYEDVNNFSPNVAYNDKDVKSQGGFTLMKHREGDVVFGGSAERGVKFNDDGEEIYLPVPEFIKDL
ncbi:hypothetical protein [Acidianus sp. HS-5]|uniref:hypothetical protein n=1 Tax=Acidianus sp. HS-5 TaxID=2886040 RepID=UPI001F3FCD67|nr:hypothetical protein [Acidianus sp. HS-5]BDC17499.1 hypothetical protein HS5_03890 [Acidianus sp. HS-5]